MLKITIILLIISVILWIISLFQKGIVLSLISLFIAILGLISSFYIHKDKSTVDVKIDLPEEYQEISKSFTKPDTLLGYYKDGTLFIEFKPK